MAGIDQYTKLLLNMDDNSFTDKMRHAISNNGVILDINNKKFGSGSAYFNGTSNLTITNNADFEFGNDSFTIDMWIKMDSLPPSNTYYMLYDKRNGNANYGSVSFMVNSSGGLGVSATSNNTSWNIINNLSIPVSMIANQWYHVALIRNGNNFSIAVNGVITSIGDSSLSIAANGNDSHIGGLVDKHKFKGYMDEVRISKGIARWTSNFTPPTTPYSYNKYLIKQNDQYYTIKSEFYKNNEYKPIAELEGKEILTQSDFETYGIDDLNLLTKTMDTEIVNGLDKGNLGNGKYFEVPLNNNFKNLINDNINKTQLKDLIPLLTSNNSNGFTISTNSKYDKDLVYKLFDKNLSTTVRFYRNDSAGGDIFIKFPYPVKIKKVQISDGTIRYKGLGNLKYYTNNSSVQFNYTKNNNNNYIINSDVNVDYISLNVYSGNQGDPIYIPEIYIYGEYFYKFLIKYNSQLYTFDGTNIALSPSQILDENNFINNGFIDVTSIAEEQWNITFPNKSDLKLLMWTDDMGKTDVSIEIGVIPFRPIDILKKNSDICNILFKEV